jgi:hypothetical protein
MERNMPSHRSRVVVALLFAGATLALREARPLGLADRASTLAIEALKSPAGGNGAEPQFTVQGDRAMLSWLEVAGKRATLTFAERTPSGWSDPRAVASGDDFFVNASDVPAVRALADGTLVGQWLQQNGPDPDAYNVRLSWSRDGGRTWSPATSPHHDGTKTQHGFVSLFQAAEGGLGLVWLDGRATNPATESGNMSLRAAGYDPSGKQLRETLIDSRVCDCCSTSAAQTADGVIVAYRDRSAGEVRDIAVSRFAAGRWSMPTAVHHDGWRIEACPINGPAISARGRDVAVAWFTAPTEVGHAFVAFSHDTGRTFGPPVRVDDAASLGRVAVEVLERRPLGERDGGRDEREPLSSARARPERTAVRVDGNRRGYAADSNSPDRYSREMRTGTRIGCVRPAATKEVINAKVCLFVCRGSLGGHRGRVQQDATPGPAPTRGDDQGHHGLDGRSVRGCALAIGCDHRQRRGHRGTAAEDG